MCDDRKEQILKGYGEPNWSRGWDVKEKTVTDKGRRVERERRTSRPIVPTGYFQTPESQVPNQGIDEVLTIFTPTRKLISLFVLCFALRAQKQ